ncbi:hypothetical protein PS395_07080 [Limosilactobacillus pontis]|uniref:hypothetical protein n=1 Tax=Limosilactobacillus pontis TaxID=35787 RepID=UPI002F262BEF
MADLLAIGKSCINAIILTIGAIGTSSFVILPSYLAQKNVHQERFALGLGKIYPYKDIVRAFIINTNSNIPLLFCSICVPLLVFCYFLNRYELIVRIGKNIRYTFTKKTVIY